MPGLRKSASGRGNAPAVIIVNNLDHPQRYAGWFGNKRAKAAIDLARASRFHVLDVDSLPLEELASRLSEGSLAGRSLKLAIVAEDLTRELETIISAREAAEAEATEPGAHGLLVAGDSAAGDASAVAGADEQARSCEGEGSNTWRQALEAGALVLAADLDRQGAADGWYEAIIVRIEGREFVLRWRDYPRDGLLTRTRQHIAILYPGE